MCNCSCYCSWFSFLCSSLFYLILFLFYFLFRHSDSRRLLLSPSPFSHASFFLSIPYRFLLLLPLLSSSSSFLPLFLFPYSLLLLLLSSSSVFFSVTSLQLSHCHQMTFRLSLTPKIATTSWIDCNQDPVLAEWGSMVVEAEGVRLLGFNFADPMKREGVNLPAPMK